MDELKACPFCGSKAEIVEYSDGSGHVECASCGFEALGMFSWGGEKSRKAEAIAAWNCRADDAALAHLARESVKRELKLAKLEAEVARWAQAEADGRLVMLKAAIGDKVHDTLADYDFVVQQADIYKNTIVYRCGNEGTEDYAAFHDSEYGERFTHKAALEGAGG